MPQVAARFWSSLSRTEMGRRRWTRRTNREGGPCGQMDMSREHDRFEAFAAKKTAEASAAVLPPYVTEFDRADR